MAKDYTREQYIADKVAKLRKANPTASDEALRRSAEFANDQIERLAIALFDEVVAARRARA